MKKKEQQQDAKSIDELQTKWAKATWKTSEKTARQDRNMFIKA